MKIFIDAGHGKNTKGKRTCDGSMREFDFNSVVAEYVKEELLKYKGVVVLFSHSYTSDVPLQDRTNYANREKADLFVSIHANADGDGVHWTGAEGIETFVYTTKPKEAVTLAQHVQSYLVLDTDRVDRGVKPGNLHVLRETNMTSILVECGFMTNEHEAILLKDDGYRRTCARAIVKGIVRSYKLVRKPSLTSPPPTRPSTEVLYRVQVGAYGNKANALNMQKALQAKGFASVVVKE